MGNYNTQYQSYYNNLARRQKGPNKFHNENNKHSKHIEFIYKEINKGACGST